MFTHMSTHPFSVPSRDTPFGTREISLLTCTYHRRYHRSVLYHTPPNQQAHLPNHPIIEVHTLNREKQIKQHDLRKSRRILPDQQRVKTYSSPMTKVPRISPVCGFWFSFGSSLSLDVYRSALPCLALVCLAYSFEGEKEGFRGFDSGSRRIASTISDLARVGLFSFDRLDFVVVVVVDGRWRSCANLIMPGCIDEHKQPASGLHAHTMYTDLT